MIFEIFCMETPTASASTDYLLNFLYQVISKMHKFLLNPKNVL